MPVFLFFFFLVLMPCFEIQAQALIDPNEAFKLAQASGKPILLVFSGSDWCAPCIRFEREVLSDSSFITYAREHVILLKADFPQRKKIAQPLQSAYEKLADTYNKEGAFPKLIVIDATQKPVATITYFKQTSATFIAELEHVLKQEPN